MNLKTKLLILIFILLILILLKIILSASIHNSSITPFKISFSFPILISLIVIFSQIISNIVTTPIL